MKKGDIIKCKDERDLKQTLQDLSAAGFHAVHDSVYDVPQIIITAVPETEYLVEARDQNGRCQKAYCDTPEEAEAAAEWLGQGYEFVEILKGYPGEWETISQSW